MDQKLKAQDKILINENKHCKMGNAFALHRSFQYFIEKDQYDRPGEFK